MSDFSLEGFMGAHPDFARSYTFECIITGGYWDKDYKFLVKTSNLPATTIDEVETNWQGYKYTLATTPTYDDYTVNVMTDLKSDIRTKMMKWSNYLNNPETNKHGKVDPNYLTTITMTHLSHNDGTGIAQYILHGCWCKTVGELAMDYATKEIAAFDLTFKYQFHTYKQL